MMKTVLMPRDDFFFVLFYFKLSALVEELDVETALDRAVNESRLVRALRVVPVGHSHARGGVVVCQPH